MTQATAFVTRISPNTVGDPRKVVDQLPDGSKDTVPFCTVLGKATGLSFRANPQDESDPAIGLKGVFESIPADPSKPVYKGPICFLPKTVHEHIVQAVLGDQKRPAGKPTRGKSIDMQGQEIAFAFEIGVKRSTNAIGYEYVTSARVEQTEHDPLADLRAKALAGGSVGNVAAIADQSGGKSAGKSKSKKGGK